MGIILLNLDAFKEHVSNAFNCLWVLITYETTWLLKLGLQTNIRLVSAEY